VLAGGFKFIYHKKGLIFLQLLFMNCLSKSYLPKVIMSADMSDSVKLERSIHCPLFFGGFSFHMQGISDLQCLLYMLSCESFLKVKDVQWIYCPPSTSFGKVFMGTIQAQFKLSNKKRTQPIRLNPLLLLSISKQQKS
jgi:hypothetical protein